MRLVWSAVIALGLAGVALADDDDAKVAPKTYSEAEVEAMMDLAKRVLKLEALQQDAEMEKLRKMAEKEKQEETQGLPGRVSKLEKAVADQKPVYDASKMLSFATPDGNFTAKIGGRLYVTYRHLFDAGSASGANKDQFSIDSARFQLDGTFYKDFYYRIEGEAKSGETVNGVLSTGFFRTKDVYLGWTGLGDVFQVQAGQFKAPISQEETCSSRFIDFAERSVLNRIVPGHVQGLMFKGSFVEKMFEYSVGVMNGAIARDSDRGTVDTNDEKDLFGRLFITPFKTMDMNLLKSIRVGVDGSWGKRDNGGAVAPTVPAVSSGDFGLPNLLSAGNAGVTIEGNQTRENLNFSWNYGPASLRAEYAVVRSELAGPANLNGAFHQTAWYIAATYLLTGEEKPLENRVKPLNNFSPADGGWGAWELAVRIAAIDAHDGVAAGVYTAPSAAATQAQNAGRNHHTDEFTFGVNWWMTPNVRMMFNYERLMYDTDQQVGNTNGGKTGFKSYEDEIYIRWQIDF